MNDSLILEVTLPSGLAILFKFIVDVKIRSLLRPENEVQIYCFINAVLMSVV